MRPCTYCGAEPFGGVMQHWWACPLFPGLMASAKPPFPPLPNGNDDSQ